MPYRMDIYTDGGCRGNGNPNAIGAAAALHIMNGRVEGGSTQNLPRHPPPTNQRAEITAIILALQFALKKIEELDSWTSLDLTIYTDSKYAEGCMTEWIYKWTRNGWVNAAGNGVVNRDLIEQASALQGAVKRSGTVTYSWIPRSQNQLADLYCNRALDQQCS